MAHISTAATRGLACSNRSLALAHNFTVLSIETSADDTCVALLRWRHRLGWELLANDRRAAPNVVHRGIHPVEAVRFHTAQLPQLVHDTMLKLPRGSQAPGKGWIVVSPAEAKASAKRHLPFAPEDGSTQDITIAKPDLIAVTRGPGMGGCLNVGVATAKALSVAWQVPIIGVHHMQAHALTSLMQADLALGEGLPWFKCRFPEYPFLTLLVSGKHTMLVYTQSATHHRVLASSNSIALGDVLDKIARQLLPPSHIPSDTLAVVYPKLMEEFVSIQKKECYVPPRTRDNEVKIYRSKHGWEIPPPMRNNRALSYNFTDFLGRILTTLRERPKMTDDERQDLAFDVMRIAFEHVAGRVILALQQDKELFTRPPKHLVLSGGVTSNLFLRKIVQSTLVARGFPDVQVIAPSPKWCTDNAAMIAYTGALMYHEKGESNHTFQPMTEWPIENILTDMNGWVRRGDSKMHDQSDAKVKEQQRREQQEQQREQQRREQQQQQEQQRREQQRREQQRREQRREQQEQQREQQGREQQQQRREQQRREQQRREQQEQRREQQRREQQEQQGGEQQRREQQEQRREQQRREQQEQQRGEQRGEPGQPRQPGQRQPSPVRRVITTTPPAWKGIGNATEEVRPLPLSGVAARGTQPGKVDAISMPRPLRKEGAQGAGGGPLRMKKRHAARETAASRKQALAPEPCETTPSQSEPTTPQPGSFVAGVRGVLRRFLGRE